jgi:hypothetical protein
MDEVALQQQITRLNAQWNHLDGWMLIFIGVVVVGVLFELAVVWVEYFRERQEYRAGDTHAIAAPSLGMAWFASIGALLVALGVGGELFLHMRASNVETALRGANEQLVALVQRDAAQATLTAESERLARIKLQTELEPRRLTTAQKQKLTSLLRGKPKAIFILPMGDDTETADLANDIGDALNKAGWKTFFSVRFSLDHGIEVGASKESDMAVLAPAIEELRGALSAVGLSSRKTLFDPNDTHLAGRFEKNALCLVIDHKPVISAPK